MDKGQQMRITQEEIQLLRSVFKDNELLVRLMRKIFLPELNAAEPIGQTLDLWMTIPVDNLTPEQALINLKARNSLIAHVEQCLNTIKILASSTEADFEALKKNSNK